MVIIGSSTLREHMNIGIMEGLKEKALGLDEVNKSDRVTIGRGDTGEDVSASHVSMLSMVKQNDDRREGVSDEGERFKETLLAREPAMVMET